MGLVYLKPIPSLQCILLKGTKKHFPTSPFFGSHLHLYLQNPRGFCFETQLEVSQGERFCHAYTRKGREEKRVFHLEGAYNDHLVQLPDHFRAHRKLNLVIKGTGQTPLQH